MARFLALLALLAFVAPAGATSVDLAPLPAEAGTDTSCIGRDHVRCLAMVYYCTYLVLVQDDIDRCLYLLE